MLAWIYLILAIALEVAGTTCMKLSEGLTHLLPSIFIFVFYGISFFVFLPLCLQTIETGVAYAVLSGLGAVFVTAIGVFAMHDSITFTKIIAIAIIIAGVAGLNLSSKTLTQEESSN